jgi:hypothetical protein
MANRKTAPAVMSEMPAPVIITRFPPTGWTGLIVPFTGAPTGASAGHCGYCGGESESSGW